MTPEQKQQLCLLLSQKQDEIRRRCAAQHNKLSDLPTRFIGDFADEATRESFFEVQSALEEHYLLELQRLTEARHRLESDDFGYCQVCKKPIEIWRLFVVPETSLCRACAADEERFARLMTGSHGGNRAK